MPVIVLRGLLGPDENESVVWNLEVFRRIGARSAVSKFFLHEDTFESALLGHTGLFVEPGPLTVAALGWDPPGRSTHFHMSLLGTDGESVTKPFGPTADEARILEVEVAKLNTKSMTVLFGEGLDHGLVWERRVELLTHKPDEAFENGMKKSLPEGDFENDLRRLIDDSINILSELDFNRRRIDQGVQPINLAWPWGHGERVRVPNRTLALGYPWRVLSPSHSLRGYARLSGFRAERIPVLDNLNPAALANLAAQAKKEPKCLIDISFEGMNGERLEEKEYKADTIARTLLLPILEDLTEWDRMALVLTNEVGDGIVGVNPGEEMFPLDERSLVERAVPEIALTRILESLD